MQCPPPPTTRWAAGVLPVCQSGGGWFRAGRLSLGGRLRAAGLTVGHRLSLNLLHLFSSACAGKACQTH